MNRLSFPLYKLEAGFIFLDPAKLPKIKANLIHAVFGKAFRDIACITKEKSCKDCMVYENCVYANVFQSELHSLLGLKTSEKRAPHPYLLNHHNENKTNYTQGDLFSLELIVFGEFIRFFPFFAMALKRIGENGLGKERAKLKLISIKNFTTETNTENIYDVEKANVRMPKEFSFPGIKDNNFPKRVELEFLTPARIQLFNKVIANHAKLNNDLLLRTLFRRVLLVSKLYNEEVPEYDFENGERLKIVENNLTFEKFKRYSSATKKEISMGGLVGKLILDVEDKETYNLLYLGQFLNIGKNVSFGFGKYVIK